jgi:hypothetical protein
MSQQASVTEINARLMVLTRQRNEAMDRSVLLEALLADTAEKNQALQQEIAELKKRKRPQKESVNAA